MWCISCLSRIAVSLKCAMQNQRRSIFVLSSLFWEFCARSTWVQFLPYKSTNYIIPKRMEKIILKVIDCMNKHLLTTLTWIAPLGSCVLCEQHFVREVKWPHVLIFNCNWNSLVSHGIWFQFVTLICRDCELILPSHVTFVNQSFKLCWSDICRKLQLYCRLAPVPGFQLF